MVSNLASIRINQTGETIPSRSWRWNADSMPDYDLVIVQRGKATYTDGQTSWQVSQGSCMFFRRFAAYAGVQAPDNPVAMLFIHFDFLDSKKRAICQPELDLLPVHFRSRRFDFVSSLARCVLEARRNTTSNAASRNSNGAGAGSNGAGSNAAGTGNNAARYTSAQDSEQTALLWLRALWAELQEQLRQPRWQGSEREQAERIEAVCMEIRKRIAEPWRLAEIASTLHCGSEHAGRLFRKYTGVSPGEFVIRTRIEAAQALLGSSSQSITEIAETLGFCDVYAFSRQFSQRTGLSPREFRR